MGARVSGRVGAELGSTERDWKCSKALSSSPSPDHRGRVGRDGEEALECRGVEQFRIILTTGRGRSPRGVAWGEREGPGWGGGAEARVSRSQGLGQVPELRGGSYGQCPGGGNGGLEWVGRTWMRRHLVARAQWGKGSGRPVESSICEGFEVGGVRGALRQAFLSADARLRALWPRGDPGGSTAVALLVSPRFLYLAHCGDSRAVLSRAGAVAFRTEDHRPLRPRERERIHDAGGTIRLRRVEGSLAVSRALGDFAFKQVPGRPPEQQLVSAEPEVTALARRAEDEFVLLASDGVWDALSGAALAELVASRLGLGLAPELLCAQLLDTCLCKGSLDNMTCILVCFPGAPGPSEEAVRRERALDAALGCRVAELCASAREPPTLNAVFRTLASEHVPDLPPGGGLHCK
uniref:protein-serine/threonine phosphatase n=1 Tax=Oryctolagus cuniculus TaxID=9986 RepID=G1U570_RABIT